MLIVDCPVTSRFIGSIRQTSVSPPQSAAVGDTHLSTDMVVIFLRELEDNTDNNAYSYSFRSTLLSTFGNKKRATPCNPHTSIFMCLLWTGVDTEACHNHHSCAAH